MERVVTAGEAAAAATAAVATRVIMAGDERQAKGEITLNLIIILMIINENEGEH